MEHHVDNVNGKMTWSTFGKSDVLEKCLDDLQSSWMTLLDDLQSSWMTLLDDLQSSWMTLLDDLQTSWMTLLDGWQAFYRMTFRRRYCRSVLYCIKPNCVLIQLVNRQSSIMNILNFAIIGNDVMKHWQYIIRNNVIQIRHKSTQWLRSFTLHCNI